MIRRRRSGTAVSYTYLDVYKRQELNIGRLLQAAKAVAQRLHRAGPAIAQLEQAAQIQINLSACQPAKEDLAAAALIPVSYTHHDVFKRQAMQVRHQVSTRDRRYGFWL